MRKYLFICSGGQHRAPTAARIAREILSTRNLEFEVKSIGISNLSKKELKETVAEYDTIIVMEKWMVNRIRRATGNRVIPRNMNLADNYTEGHEKHLELELRRRLSRYI